VLYEVRLLSSTVLVSEHAEPEQDLGFTIPFVEHRECTFLPVPDKVHSLLFKGCHFIL
jgi:hypothetical protein